MYLKISQVEMIDWQGEDLSPKKNNGIVRYTIIPGTSSYDLPSDGALVNSMYKYIF